MDIYISVIDTVDLGSNTATANIVSSVRTCVQTLTITTQMHGEDKHIQFKNKAFEYDIKLKLFYYL